MTEDHIDYFCYTLIIQKNVCVYNKIDIKFLSHHSEIVIVQGTGHLLARLRRTRSIGRSPDVESWRKTVLQASLTPIFLQLSPPCEL